MCECACVCVLVCVPKGEQGSFTLYFLLLSFGQCINSNVRSDQCHILEPTELLRVSHIWVQHHMTLISRHMTITMMSHDYHVTVMTHNVT